MDFDFGELAEIGRGDFEGDILSSEDFGKFVDGIGTDIGDYTVDDGKLKYKGVEIDMEKLNEAIETGDLGEVFKDLGADMENPDVKDFVDKYQATYNEQPGIKDVKSVKDTEVRGKSISDKVGDVKNGDDLQKALDKNSELNEDLKKKIDDLKKKLDEDSKAGKKSTVGKWVKRLLVATAVFATAAEIAALIGKHQDAMNGCWLVERSSGNKCKVGILTCDSDARSQAQSDGTNCQQPINGCGKNKNEQCFIAGKTCVEYNPAVSGQDPACKIYLAQCNSGQCSTYCDNTKIDVPDGYFLTCVNVDFWGAAEDLFQEPFNLGSSILGNITKILKYVLYGFLLLLGIYIVYKLVSFFMSGSKHSS